MEPRKSYPSDISREQFERIRPLLESVRKRTKPRTVDLHEVFNAVLYLLKAAASGACFPQGFPTGSRCMRTSPNGARRARTG